MKLPIFWGVVVPALLRSLIPARFLESPLALASRHPWLTLAAAGAALAVGGFAVAASGVIPITASSGHWPITEWFLQFSKRQSIRTHAMTIDAPPLDDPALILRGAGHYDLGCRPCHGAVAGERPRIPLHMLPAPPDLTLRVPERTSEQLFHVVKHGLKFTGMPAWPSQQRDDEVWAVVAFMRKLPEMTRDEYQRLTAAERGVSQQTISGLEPPPDAVLSTCGRCHGLDGQGRGRGAFPKLAGQRAEYLDRALRAYADSRRHSGIMGPIAAALSDEARRAVVAYFAAQPAMTPAAPSSATAARGALIAIEGLDDRMIPACVACHGPTTTSKNAAYPRLAGQDSEYLGLQLRLLQERRRGGSEYVHLMHSFVDRLKPAQIADVTHYFGSLRMPDAIAESAR